jgi:cytochrome c-type biogenesis protein CcmH
MTGVFDALWLAMKPQYFVSVILALLVLASPAHAVRPDEILPDAKLEQRARQISAGLRCLVCQNQSIDDSDASLAKDLRILVRDRLKAGDTDLQVKDFLVARYGNFILLKPPFEWDTLLLWLSPFAILGLGAAAILAARRKGEDKRASPLSEEESARLKGLLDEGR